MYISNDPNVWIIYALIFLLGLLLGVFLTAGGRRKWKTRYQDEVTRRETLEREHKDRLSDYETRSKAHEAELAERDRAHEARLAEREREWREQDSLRSAALKDRRKPSDDRPL